MCSKWSGKCDVYDSLVAIQRYTDEELANNVNIYMGFGENQKKLDIKCNKDLIPYYPHLIATSWHDNAERKASIHITSESFVDREERESLEFCLKELLKIYNRCKRKKIEFDIDEAVKEVTFNGWNEEPYRKLAIRVKEKGRKATVDGIHLKMHEYYRQQLVDTMIENGLNPADYGYERFCKGEQK